MARRRKDDDDSIVEFIVGIFILYIVSLYFSNRAAFYHQLWYLGGIVIAIIIMIFVFNKIIYNWREKKFNNLIVSVKDNDLEDYIKNFIDRWGVQKGKKNDYKYREHSFDWDRLEDFRKVLNEKGMKLSVNKWDNTLILLKHYIQKKEENLTRESISVLPKKFSSISGSNFENLLYRLFRAMGYFVQKTGQTGDQGGDLIANLNGQRIVIQAKCYAEAVSNKAIQEAVAAQKFYNANKAMVVTNSNFTNGAIELAKVNDVELIGGEKLSELILQHLKENWS